MVNSQSYGDALRLPIFLKLGGSLITDKTKVEHARKLMIRRLAREIKAAREAKPDLRLVLGHGSGSFGHVAAKKHNTRQGVADRAGWLGFSEVAAAAARLNQIVIEIFVQEGVPVISLPPSASARCADGVLRYLDIEAVGTALKHDLVPVVQGDVAFDELRGATIVSTEDVFVYLAKGLRPTHILLAGEVAGVYEQANLTGAPIPVITPVNVSRYDAGLGGSQGADVTGGMASKVNQMLDVVKSQPAIQVRIFSGAIPSNVRRLLVEPEAPIGTIIRNASL